MKKLVSFLLVICISATMSGCSRMHKLSFEESRHNFEEYTKSFVAIAEKYSCILDPWEYEENFFNYEAECNFIIDNNSYIEIYLENCPGAAKKDDSDKGVEFFRMRYHINPNVPTAVDYDLFVELVNAVSGYTTSTDEIIEFVNADEEEYPIGKIGGSVKENVIVAKAKPINFFENWILSHIVYNDGITIISMSGYTKACCVKR